MISSLLFIASGVTLLAVMFLSCVSDVRTLRIPNIYSLVVTGAFILAFIIKPDAFGIWWQHFLAAGIFFVITYIMFCLGMVGGGDAKLGSAFALWVGMHGLIHYVFYMSLAGGLLGLMTMIFRKYKMLKLLPAGTWRKKLEDGGNAVPYGVALVIGALISIFHTGLITQQLHELMSIIY